MHIRIIIFQPEADRRMRMCVCVPCVHNVRACKKKKCVRASACVCGGGGKNNGILTDQHMLTTIWNKCVKGKGKEVERRSSVSVMNSPSSFVHGYTRRGQCVGLCQGHPSWYIPTEFVWYMTMYIESFVQGNSIPT